MGRVRCHDSKSCIRPLANRFARGLRDSTPTLTQETDLQEIPKQVQDYAGNKRMKQEEEKCDVGKNA